MNRFPTNKFTGAALVQGMMQALIREVIITTGTAHASNLFYPGM
jgi:hypothetical protein